MNVAAADPIATTPAPTSDDIDVGFGKAIVVGSLIGIVATIALIMAVVHTMNPDFGWGGAAAVGVWTGIWTGLFVGGTVKVGLWSKKHFH